ncbi:hypothetical protein FIN92_09620 [Prevotella brunnea]|uniref:hypothetical protein n=1 Tax=Prevotella brunnea TaxID=2508867 RepID=UPI002822DE81|nr:hypothetical protein [Prevotella brunnea]MDR0186814.1 hypothetical protein [Prevotella brunnea]
MERYKEEVIRVLIEAGANGLPVRKISCHVFNACNSFFFPISPDDVHLYVRSYLYRTSLIPNSEVIRIKRGRYKINPQNIMVKLAKQSLLNKLEVAEQKAMVRESSDNSLCLF